MARPGRLTSKASTRHRCRPPALRTNRSTLSAQPRALHALLSLDGLYGCAVADAGTGKLVAQQTCDARQVDLDQAAAAAARLLDAHRAAAQEMSLPEVEEVTVSAGSCMQIAANHCAAPGSVHAGGDGQGPHEPRHGAPAYG